MEVTREVVHVFRVMKAGRYRLMVRNARGSFYIDSTHISFIFGSICVDECRLLPCVYLCIILTFKYQLFVSY